MFVNRNLITYVQLVYMKHRFTLREELVFYFKIIQEVVEQGILMLSDVIRISKDINKFPFNIACHESYPSSFFFV